jgi:hypothetical protein
MINKISIQRVRLVCNLLTFYISASFLLETFMFEEHNSSRDDNQLSGTGIEKSDGVEDEHPSVLTQQTVQDSRCLIIIFNIIALFIDCL